MARNMKNVWYLYQARRVATQANAAGGAMVIDITVSNIARIVQLYVVNSGTNSILAKFYDEDNADGIILASIASGAATSLNLPATGTATPASGSPGNSTEMIIGPGQKLAIVQSVAGLQNDTITVAPVFLLNTPTEPTWDKSRSTNQANVTIAASTISTANTLRAVVL